MLRDDLGDRMKKYEYVTRTHLVPRTPVIIRIDGKSFHTFTKGFKKPFDDVMVTAMQETMKYLCQNIQGCVLGYTQSDEITLVLIDYKKLNSDSWFDYNIQKVCSVAASMATMAFNKAFHEQTLLTSFKAIKSGAGKGSEEHKYCKTLMRAYKKGAMFDARCFNIPKEEVTNCILWRQLDAMRNSVEMVGHCNFSDNQLHKKSCENVKDMLLDKGINWDELPIHLQRGSCCIRKVNQETGRSHWDIDENIPIFKGEDRKYIDELIMVGEE